MTFENLYPGEYRLTETNAAPGYYLPDSSWTIVVTATGVVQVNGTDLTAEEDGSYMYNIENQPGAELPETGGPGLIMMERFGWMLLLLAMLGAEIQIFGSRRKREE